MWHTIGIYNYEVIMLGIDDAIAEGLKIINKFVPDKDGQAKAAAEYNAAILAADTQLAVAQIEINKIEAANEHIFISGWRPFVGWCCGVAMAYHFILQPFIVFIMAAFGHVITLPTFDMATLNTVLMGLLGLGSLRTMEKLRK